MPNLNRALIADLDAFKGLSSEALDEIVGFARSARFPRDTAISSRTARRTHSSSCWTATFAW
jgi:hypothetical protein